MNLLSKIQNKIHGKPEANTSGHAKTEIEQLNKLPDTEKVKVLDYLKSLKNLSTNEPA